MLWWGLMQRPKGSTETLLVWDAERGKHWRAAPDMCWGSCGVEQWLWLLLSGHAHRGVWGDLTRVSCLPYRTWAEQLSSTFPLTSAGSHGWILKTGLNFKTLCVSQHTLLLQLWGIGTLPLQARTNFARENCRNSSRYTFWKCSSVNLFSYFSCLLHIFNISSFGREDWMIYFVG